MKNDLATGAVLADQCTNSWVSRAHLRLIGERVGTPVFVYSEKQLVRNIARIKEAAASAGIGERVELYVPFFPNSNPHALRALQKLGIGVLVQLPNEYKLLRLFGFNKFIVSPGHVSDTEIGFWTQTGYPTFLSSLDEVAYALRNNAPSISVRIDSLDSEKPGIKFSQLNALSDALKAHSRDLECFEVYCGSGKTLDEMIRFVEQVFDVFRTHFPTARSINFAGGHGFVYEAWDESKKHFEWNQYFDAMRQTAARFGVADDVKFLFEPARDVLADIGVLLLKVKRNVITNPKSSLVVTDGSRMLMPSAQLRSRRHNVLFIDGSSGDVRSSEPSNSVFASLRGRSILRNDYILPGEYRVPSDVRAEDYVAILDVGAYCATQHMEFLNIPPAAEVVIESDGAPYLVSSHGGELDKWRHLLTEKKMLARSELGSLAWI